MSIGINAEAVALQGWDIKGSLASVRPILALGMLGAGIVLNFAWIGTVGWFSLHLMGLA